VPLWVKIVPLAAALGGIVLAWQLYMRRRDLPDALMHRNWPLYRLLLNKWYFDELYDLIFVRPAQRLGRALWLGGDGRIIDGFGPNWLASAVVELARRASGLQTGYIYHYAFVMLIGVAVLVTFYFYMLGR
jgi:NADH-quinone oxidoreductase subunit L